MRANLRATARPIPEALSPLVGLTVPAEAVAATVAVVRRLDHGRLCAPVIVDAAGWVAGASIMDESFRHRGHVRS